MLSKKEYIVFEFGAINIKLITATIENKVIKVSRMELIPTPRGCMENGRIKDTEQLGAKIAEFVRTNMIKQRNAIITITNQAVMMREVSVPNTKPSVIKSFVQVESQNYFPMDLTGCVVDYKFLTHEEGENGIEVKLMLAALPLEIAEEYISVLKMAGFSIAKMDISSDSIVKLYSNHSMAAVLAKPLEQDVSTAFVDFGAETTNITIAVNNVLKYNKQIPFGSKQITELFADIFDLTIEEAEEAKRNYLMPVGNLEEDIRVDKLENMLAEFEESLSIFFVFHSSRKTGYQIDEIIMLGGGSYFSNLDKYFAELYSINVQQGFTLDAVEFDEAILDLDKKLYYFYNCLGALCDL